MCPWQGGSHFPRAMTQFISTYPDSWHEIEKFSCLCLGITSPLKYPAALAAGRAQLPLSL